MAVDNPDPLCTPADLQDGAFADLVQAFDQEALLDICVEASRACETEVERRFIPFTITESHRADGLDPDELGGMGSTIGLDLTAALGVSYANAIGAGGDLVRKVWVREYAPRYQEMWSYSNVSVRVTPSIGGGNQVTPMKGPMPDSGLLWFTLGTFCPVGSLIEVTYSGGYQTVPADLRRAAKWMAAAIALRELDPSQHGSQHDPGTLESLATGWLQPYARTD